jgi:hypothetical protein
MTEELGPKGGQRGEPAWKDAKAQVAERNKQARRAAKQRREAHERRQADARHEEERRATAELLRRHPAG